MDKERKQLQKAIIEYGVAKLTMEEAFNRFGKQFRERRKKEGLSLREAAKLIHVSAPYLSDVELGRRKANCEVVSFFKDQELS